MNRILSIKQKIFIYIVLSVYAFAMIRPITPIVSDAIAHSFFKIQHMATVHYENGSYHIHKELEKASKEPAPVNTSNLIVESLLLHLQNATILVPVDCPSNALKSYFTFINLPVDICLTFPTPPPKA